MGAKAKPEAVYLSLFNEVNCLFYMVDDVANLEHAFKLILI